MLPPDELAAVFLQMRPRLSIYVGRLWNDVAHHKGSEAHFAGCGPVAMGTEVAAIEAGFRVIFVSHAVEARRKCCVGIKELFAGRAAKIGTRYAPANPVGCAGGVVV